MHRDIKPANVFLDNEGQVKLGDFGLARILHNTSLAKTFVGTPYYMSPELYSCNSYDDRSDLWSVGCLLYELCTLRPPFIAPNQHKLAECVLAGRFARIPTQYSDELHETIANLLHVNPDRRPLLTRLLVVLEEKLVKSDKMRSKKADSKEKLLEDDELKKSEEQLMKREEFLRKKEDELCKREQEIKRKEKVLQTKETQLIRREESLKKKEKELYSQ